MRNQHRRKAVLVVFTLFGLLALGGCSDGWADFSFTSPLPGSTSETRINSADISSEVNTNSPVALEYQPTSDELLMATSMGLLRWKAGDDWTKVNIPDAAAGLSGVVINPEQPGTIYASGLHLGVIRSNDGGESWQPVNAGLPSLDVTALALNSVRREMLYAWVRDDGIYRTENGGDSWERVPDSGPADADVRGLTHSTLPGSMNTGWLYAATPSGAYISMDCF